MIEWIFTFLLVYLLYKLVFDFIIPVSKASAQVRSKINQMQQQQREQQTASTRESNKANTRPPKEDYIDFEEIK